MCFVPLAERFGLILDIGDWVIDEACRQMRVWADAGLLINVAINVSSHQLSQRDLVGRIEAALRRYRIDASQLLCEITESVAMSNLVQTQRTLEGLARIGVFLSIDDFGTGHSSLASLRQLPARQLKIDRSFVRDIDSSADARAVVDAVVRLAHALGLSVVAEGVETAAQRDVLLELDATSCRAISLRGRCRPGSWRRCSSVPASPIRAASGDLTSVPIRPEPPLDRARRSPDETCATVSARPRNRLTSASSASSAVRKARSRGGLPAMYPSSACKPAFTHRQIAPADHLLVPQQRQGVVAAQALGSRRVGLEPVGPAPELLEAASVPDDRIERRQQAHALVGPVAPRCGVFVGRPEPERVVDAGDGRRSLARASAAPSSGVHCGAPLRRCSISAPRLGAGSGAYSCTITSTSCVQRRRGIGRRLGAASRRRVQRGCRHRAARCAACRGSAFRRAAWCRPCSSRRTSSTPCRAQTAHRHRAGGRRRARARSPAPHAACAIRVGRSRPGAACADASAPAARAARSRS